MRYLQANNQYTKQLDSSLDFILFWEMSGQWAVRIDIRERLRGRLYNTLKFKGFLNEI
jgi:hypothetical protein